MTVATTSPQALQQATSTSAAATYDIFSKTGHACCIKLENEAVGDVFEQDESKTEVMVSWSNGMHITSRNDNSASCSAYLSPETNTTISSFTYKNVASLERRLDTIGNARLKVM